MRKQLTIFSLCLLLFIPLADLGAQEASSTAWDAAISAYRADQLDAALSMLTDYRRRFPADPRADDALWFIGRIHAKAGRAVQAEQAFGEVMALPSRSNRFPEAARDLARLLASQGRTGEAIGVLESARPAGRPSGDARRVVRLLAELLADRASANRKAYRDQQAQEGWLQAASLYEVLVEEPEDAAELQDDLGALGSVWQDLARAAPDAAAHEAARGKAIDSWRKAAAALPESARASRLEAKAAALERGERPRVEGTVEALGGAAPFSIPASAYVKWGARGSVDLVSSIPLGWQQELRIGMAGSYDDFSIKTSNFTAAEQAAGAVRIVQRTGDLGASLAWHAGSRHGLHSELELSGAWRPAEDLGDTSYGFTVTERLDWRLSPAWKLGLDVSAGWEAWPDDLLVMSREMDRWEASVNPKATWYLSQDLSLSAGYAFALRQYLAAVYPPDTANKQHLVHEADLGLRWTPGKVVRLSLDYALTWNDTRFYTMTLFGSPADLVVPDYYDYLEHAVELRADLRWSADLRTTGSATLAGQAFTSYPARDATRTFTGEKRADLLLALDAEAAWRFWQRTANGFADLWAVAAASWQRSSSNNLWEDSIQTNFSAARLTAGVRAELP